MDATALRARYIELLLERVEESRFPSTDYLNRIEAAIRTREQAERYASVLMQKVEEPRYPSLPLLDRLRRVLDSLPAGETETGAEEDGRR